MRTFIAVAVAALFTVGLTATHEAAACSPPSSAYSFEDDIPDTIPVRGALPVVFGGSSATRATPLEDPGVTFEVRNSNDKLIPGDAELYTIDAEHFQYGSRFDILVAWRPTDGWATDETYTLTLRTTPEWGEPEELEHPFTAVEASGDVADPSVDSAGLTVREDRAASDCCVPNPDVIDSCTGQPVSECWTTEFEYTPVLRVDLAPVPDDIWASQTLFTVIGNANQPQPRASITSTTRFSRVFALSDSSFCLAPRAVRIADGSLVTAPDVCRDRSDLPDYEQRDASEVVGVPSECRDETEADAGGGDTDAGPDTGDGADAGNMADAGGDADNESDANDGGDDGTTTPGGESSGCGCASSGTSGTPTRLLLLFIAVGLLRRRA